MINLTINHNDVTGEIEGTLEEIMAEYALLTYSFWTRTAKAVDMPLETFLSVLHDATTHIPETYTTVSESCKNKSYTKTKKTGVLN